MIKPHNRRRFLKTTVATGIASYLGGTSASTCARGGTNASGQDHGQHASKLVVNDDAHVFLWLSDDLAKDDLRRYLQTYCRPGVSTVAYCVGDMSWPTFYPSKIGTHFSNRIGGNDPLRERGFNNVSKFDSVPQGYYGATFEILHELGKKVLASFRMNDAHLASNPNDPYTSDFWRQHKDLTLGSEFGYYNGCLNYTHEAVRNHFVDLVLEFVELYPQVDGIELDAMRSPFFFPAGKGQENAQLITDVIYRIKNALADQAKRLNRPNYLLSINLPRTSSEALDWGLDAASWDKERLFDFMAVGPYHADMTIPFPEWKAQLAHGTPVYSYFNVAPRNNGNTLGLEEYRAAAANSYGGGADGMYLFNFPYFLARQSLVSAGNSKPSRPDLARIGQVLDEIGRPESLRDKNKHYLFYFNTYADYRHYAPVLAGVSRKGVDTSINAQFPCFEEYDRAREVTLRFKVANVTRDEQFQISLNDQAIEPNRCQLHFAEKGRESRTAENFLGPYLQVEIVLRPSELRSGENKLDITPSKIDPSQATTINLNEVELRVVYT